MQTLTLRSLTVPAVGLVATLSLAGCTLFPSPAQPANNVTVTTNNGTGNISFSNNSATFNASNGNSSLSFGQGLPADWPNDLPSPKSATVAFAGSEKDQAKHTVTYSASFALTTTDATAALGELKAAFQAAGWSISDESLGQFGITAGGFQATKGQQKAEVAFVGVSGSANAQENGATITISGEYPL
ncbi:MAG: hypothetical protein U0514_03550 [Candidatus Andersenbacteria bacterium]